MSDSPSLDPRWVINLSGKDVPLYAGVLDLAHQSGLESIHCELIQIPTEENGHTAIAKATARLKDGRECSDYGDANPKNTSGKVALALVRMAMTRAKGRALRDLTNVGQTLAEEMDDAPAANTAAPARANGAQTPHAAARAKEAAEERAEGAKKAITAAGSTAGSTPGFEDTYTQPGVRHYTRVELIEGTGKRLEQARALGLEVPAHKPELMANKALFGLAEKLAEEIKAAKAAAQAGTEGA